MGIMGSNVKKLPYYEGYFTVKVPDKLLKLLGDDIFKMRTAVNEFDQFLKQYGELYSVLAFEDGQDHAGDEFYWIHYTAMSFLLPIGKNEAKVIVRIQTRSRKLMENLQEGYSDGNLEIVLKGSAFVRKDNIDNIDEDLVDIKIKQIKAFWNGENHSYSPDVEVIEQMKEQAKKDLTFRDNTFLNKQLNIDKVPSELDEDDVPF
jgi:hypothetical protein